MTPNRLLDLLRAEGSLDDRALRAATERAAKTGEDLASACFALKLASERTLVRALCQLHGYPGIELCASVIRVANVGLVPEDVMRKKLVLPVMDSSGELIVAMADPDDPKVYDRLRFLTGRKVLRHVGLPAALRATIDHLLQLQRNGEKEWRGKDAGKSNAPPEGRAAIVHPHEASNPEAGWFEAEEMPVVMGTEVSTGPDASWAATLFDKAELPAPPSGKPAASPPPPPAAARLLQEPATVKLSGFGAGKTVLVVDDDPDMRGLLQKILEPFGCSVAEAAEGQEALSLCRDLQPNLLILDAMLPGMHGFEICRVVKGDPKLRQAGVIIVSGIYTGWKIGVDVKEVYGADYFFEKPFRVEEFSRAVRLMLLGLTGDEKGAKARRQAALDACQEAVGRAKEGKLQEAIALLRAAVQKDPFSAEPHFFLGQILRRARESYQAVAALERAAELRPDLYQPLALLGDLYLQLGFKKTAREVLDRALGVCSDAQVKGEIQKRLAAL